MSDVIAAVRPGMIWILAIVMAGMVIGKIISTSASLKEVISQNRLGIYLSWEILKIAGLVWVLASVRSLYPMAEGFLYYMMAILSDAGLM